MFGTDDTGRVTACACTDVRWRDAGNGWRYWVCVVCGERHGGVSAVPASSGGDLGTVGAVRGVSVGEEVGEESRRGPSPLLAAAARGGEDGMTRQQVADSPEPDGGMFLVMSLVFIAFAFAMGAAVGWVAHAVAR